VLHSRGYRVAVTGQRSESVTRAREELPEDVLVLQADARSLADTDAVMSEVRERFGTLSTLCLNAGVSRPATLEAADEAAFHWVPRGRARIGGDARSRGHTARSPDRRRCGR
jgi:NADP-dependent 3-hydroxy acid dehydrogenase YdfG